MFITNKYYKVYYNIINRAMSRTLDKDTYSEKHHIIPKSLGGNNDKDNIAVLTAKEHFICHLLLPKMTEGTERKRMLHAAWRMSQNSRESQKRYTPSSNTYAILRKEHANIMREKMSHTMKGNTIRKGVTLSEAQKKKQSESMKGKPAWNKGIERTQEVKDAISKANKGKTPWNKGVTRAWINNGQDQKLVILPKADALVEQGWIRGRLR